MNLISSYESDLKNLSRLSVNLVGSLSVLQKELQAVDKANKLSSILLKLDMAHSEMLQSLVILERQKAKLGYVIDTIISGRPNRNLITPTQLQKAIKMVRKQLPSSLQITFHRDESLWTLYKHSRAMIMISGTEVHVIIRLKLADSESNYKLIKAYNIPIPIFDKEPA